MTDNPIARPQPITREDREFIAQVEQWVPDALFQEVAREFAPADRAPEELARQMGEAAPGDRLRTAVEAGMSGSRHFEPLPPAERSAAAEQASLAVAQAIDSSLTVENSDPTSRLGAVAGKVLDRAFRGQYRELADHASNRASEVLSGALNWSRYHQMQEAQRHAGAVRPAAAAPSYQSADAGSSAKPPAASKDSDRGRIARD
jgi:hypothetical protein